MARNTCDYPAISSGGINIHEETEYVVGAATVAAVTGAQVRPRRRPCAMAHILVHIYQPTYVSETACEILCMRFDIYFMFIVLIQLRKRAIKQNSLYTTNRSNIFDEFTLVRLQ